MMRQVMGLMMGLMMRRGALTLSALSLSTWGAQGCGYRWGPQSSASATSQTYRRLLSVEGRFELTHDGSLGQGRGALLSELLSAYLDHQAPLEALEQVSLSLSFQRRPLSPVVSTLEATLRLSSSDDTAEGLEGLSLKASMTGPTVTASGALASPVGGLALRLARRLGAQLAMVMLGRSSTPAQASSKPSSAQAR